VSYEALIAAQAKRLTKKRERKMGIDWSPLTFAELRERAMSPPRTYADLYVPPAPERVEVRRTPVYEHEMSHKEWADGYKEWALERKYDEVARDIFTRYRKPCFAENEI
jgi:hypothetical protein